MPNPDPHESRQPVVTRRRAIVVAAVVVAVAVVVLAVRLSSDDQDDASAPADSPTSSPTGSGAPTPSPSPGAAPSASAGPGGPSAAPSATPGPGATVPTSTPPPTTEAPIDDASDLGNGVTVDVPRIEAVDGKARGVGEIAAPSIRFVVRVRNDTGRSVSLGNSVVNVSYGRARTPAGQLSGPGAKAMPATVAAGASARGVYVFSVPEDERGRVQVSYSYDTAAPTVVFTGRAR